MHETVTICVCVCVDVILFAVWREQHSVNAAKQSAKEKVGSGRNKMKCQLDATR